MTTGCPFRRASNGNVARTCLVIPRHRVVDRSHIAFSKNIILDTTPHLNRRQPGPTELSKATLKGKCWCKPRSQPSCATTRAISPKGNGRATKPATSAAGPCVFVGKKCLLMCCVSDDRSIGFSFVYCLFVACMVGLLVVWFVLLLSVLPMPGRCCFLRVTHLLHACRIAVMVFSLVSLAQHSFLRVSSALTVSWIARCVGSWPLLTFIAFCLCNSCFMRSPWSGVELQAHMNYVLATTSLWPPLQWHPPDKSHDHCNLVS